MKYLYIVFLQQWLWHPELLPLRLLFIMNTLLASLLVPELFCIQTVFRGFLPFTCLEVVIFNNVFTSGRKTGQQLEMWKTLPSPMGLRFTPLCSWCREFSFGRVCEQLPRDTANWTLAPPRLNASEFIMIALNWTIFPQASYTGVGGHWCKPCRCPSVVLVCGNLFFPRYRVKCVVV